MNLQLLLFDDPLSNSSKRRKKDVYVVRVGIEMEVIRNTLGLVPDEVGKNGIGGGRQ